MRINYCTVALDGMSYIVLEMDTVLIFINTTFVSLHSKALIPSTCCYIVLNNDLRAYICMRSSADQNSTSQILKLLLKVICSFIKSSNKII